MDKYRKLIGNLAVAAGELVALWAGAPAWLLALGPVLHAVATWGLYNAPTNRQVREILERHRDGRDTQPA